MTVAAATSYQRLREHLAMAGAAAGPATGALLRWVVSSTRAKMAAATSTIASAARDLKFGRSI